MIAGVYIDTIKIGEVDLSIIDISMGAVGGDFIPNENYLPFKLIIQQLTNKNGVANSVDFNFSIVLYNGLKIEADGGIGVTDVPNFDVYIESAGLNQETLRIIQNSK